MLNYGKVGWLVLCPLEGDDSQIVAAACLNPLFNLKAKRITTPKYIFILQFRIENSFLFSLFSVQIFSSFKIPRPLNLSYGRIP